MRPLNKPLQNILSQPKLQSLVSTLKKDLFLFKTCPDLSVEEEQNNVVTKTQEAAKGRERKKKKRVPVRDWNNKSPLLNSQRESVYFLPFFIRAPKISRNGQQLLTVNTPFPFANKALAVWEGVVSACLWRKATETRHRHHGSAAKDASFSSSVQCLQRWRQQRYYFFLSVF